MRLWCHNDRMACRKAVSPWRVSAVAFALILPIATHVPAYQSPVQQPEQGSASDLKLTAAEEKDSYDIYSMLLRTEMPTIEGWAIKQETQPFPHDGHITFNVCVQPPQVDGTYEELIFPLVEAQGEIADHWTAL